jgi:hypothetical protein
MRRTTLAIAGILLVLNVVTGILLSNYQLQNVLLSSSAIILTAVLICLSATMPLKGGFKVSLPFIFMIIGVVEFVLGVVSKHTFQDNWAAIVALALLAFEIVVLILAWAVSKNTR